MYLHGHLHDLAATRGTLILEIEQALAYPIAQETAAPRGLCISRRPAGVQAQCHIVLCDELPTSLVFSVPWLCIIAAGRGLLEDHTAGDSLTVRVLPLGVRGTFRLGRTHELTDVGICELCTRPIAVTERNPTVAVVSEA